MKKKAALAATILMGASLVGCNAAQTYTDYVQAVLDCTYFGITDKYMELTESTKEESDAVYDEEVTYVAELICYNLAVQVDYVSEETMEGYEAVAKDLISKVKYTVDTAEKSGDAYHITVNCEPIDYWDIVYEDVEAFYNDGFGERYEAAATEEELAELEEEYAVEVLEIAGEYVSKIEYKEPVKKIVEITIDEEGLYGIEDQDWLDIDDLLLDMNANT